MSTAPARTLADICRDALGANCGHCWACPGEPCRSALSGGIHVARLDRAYRRGIVSPADFMAAIGALGAFTEASVLYQARELAA